MKYFIASLGCAKNTVDSESMAIILNRAGHSITDNPQKADILIVNTCGFIEQARQETLDVLMEFAQMKRANQFLIAAGCFSQRFPQALINQVPQIDGVLGTRRWMDILILLEKLLERETPQAIIHLPPSQTIGTDEQGVVRASIQGGSAYLKIADGCRHSCAYCAIPLIKGKTVSRPVDHIVRDAKVLQDQGIQEMILIAQDTTDYGSDLNMKDGLAILLEHLQKEASQIPWIRILYMYPGLITDRLIDVIANSKQILPYIDLPLQHASPCVLKLMRRPQNIEQTIATVQKLRDAIPNVAIRSTFIVGHPGETEIDYQILLDFIREMQFDHLGGFTYSLEIGTPGEKLGDNINQTTKDDRLEKLMLLQEEISFEKNRRFVNQRMKVLTEGSGDGITIGRSYRDAPEIDGLVIVSGIYPVGKIIETEIVEALPHDLVAKVV
jgi:ribosomal protein S12 methylthiotransferase